jgi:hypothetical protein
LTPDPNPPRRPRPPSTRSGFAAPVRLRAPARPDGAAPGARESVPCPSPSRRVVATGERIVARLLARRLRVCRDLGIPVPEQLRAGPPETLLLRLTGVDRRLTRELEARGGVALPPWSGEPDPLDLPGELPGDDEGDDDDLDEQGEPAWAA